MVVYNLHMCLGEIKEIDAYQITSGRLVLFLSMKSIKALAPCIGASSTS